MARRRKGVSVLLLGVVLPSSAALGALSLSATTFTRGVSASGTILGATVLSVITTSGLPAGFTINSAARTWAWDGTGSGSANNNLTLIETLAGSTRSTTISYAIAVTGLTAPTFLAYSGSGSTSLIGSYGLTEVGVPDPPQFWFAFASDVGEGDFAEQQIDTVNTFDSGNLRDQERQLGWDGNIGTSGILVVNGDSLTASGANSYATQWGAIHTGYTVINVAVGGSGASDVIAREATVIADEPNVYSVLIGSNDIYDPNGASYAETMLQHMDRVKVATGCKCVLWTSAPEHTADPTFTATRAGRRAAVDSAYRTALASGRIDGIVDLAADPVMGPDAAALDTTLYSDGTHPTTLGYTNLANLAIPVLNRAFNLGGYVLLDPATQVVSPFNNQQALTPSTTYYARRRIRRDYGDTSIYSGWSSTVSLSVAAGGITFAFNPLNHATWDATDQVLSNSNKTWKAAVGAAGARSSIRSTLSISGNGTKIYFGYNVDSWDAGGSGGGFGVCTDTYGGTAGSLASVPDCESNRDQTAVLRGSGGDLYTADVFVVAPAGVDIAVGHRVGFAIKVNVSDMTMWILEDGVCGHGVPGTSGGFTIPFTAVKAVAILNPDGGTNQQVTICSLAQATTDCPASFTPAGA